MKTTKEMIAVMQAYEEGKTIEVFYNNKWTRIDEPSWDWVSKDYRVKPEPECEPYTNVNDILADSEKHGRYVICKEDCRNGRRSLDYITNQECTIHGCHPTENTKLFTEVTWADGHPFGKSKTKDN